MGSEWESKFYVPYVYQYRAGQSNKYSTKNVSVTINTFTYLGLPDIASSTRAAFLAKSCPGQIGS